MEDNVVSVKNDNLYDITNSLQALQINEDNNKQVKNDFLYRFHLISKVFMLFY